MVLEISLKKKCYGITEGRADGRMNRCKPVYPHFFKAGYNNPKDLDPSYKTFLDLWDCFGRKKSPSYNRRNSVFFFIFVSLLQCVQACQISNSEVQILSSIPRAISRPHAVPYFFGYKTEIFPSKTIPKI